MTMLVMKLWNDEGGFILSTEAMILWTITVLGATAGLVAVRNATATKLTETANTIATFDQSYGYPGIALVGPNGQNSALVAGSNAVNTQGVPGNNNRPMYSLSTTWGSPNQVNSSNIVSVGAP